jgi:hypothetical protein
LGEDTHAALFLAHANPALLRLNYVPEEDQGGRGRYFETTARYQHVSGLKLYIHFNPMEKWAAVEYGRIWTWVDTGFVRISGRYSAFMEYFGETAHSSFKIDSKPVAEDIQPILDYLLETLPILEKKLDEESLIEIEERGGLGDLREKLKARFPDVTRTVTPLNLSGVR